MIRICKDLLEEGGILQILDPKVSERQMALDLGQAADGHQAAGGGGGDAPARAAVAAV